MIATLTIGYRDRNRVLATNGTLRALRCVECGWLAFPRGHLAALVDIACHGHPPRPVIQVTIHGVGPVWEGTEPFGVLVGSHLRAGVILELDIDPGETGTVAERPPMRRSGWW